MLDKLSTEISAPVKLIVSPVYFNSNSVVTLFRIGAGFSFSFHDKLIRSE